MKPFFLFSKETKGEGYVPNNELFAYASGLTGQNLTYSYTSSWLRYFYINLLHMNPLKVGTVFSISYVWDAINDPIIGTIVDRRQHKPYRKMRPFLLYMPPIIGLLVVAMFLNLHCAENLQLVFLVATYFLYDFFYSFQDVGLWGMIALSSPHSEERSRVAQWVSIGAGAGGAIVGIFQQVRTMLNGAGVSDAKVFFIFALIFGLGGELISMNAYRMKERVAVAPVEKKESLWQTLSVLKHNPTLILICLARLSQSFSPKLQDAYFFESKVTFMNGQSAQFLFGLFAGVLGACAMFFANKIAKKVGGMKKLLVISQVTAIVLRLIAFFVGFNSLPQFIIMTVLIAIVNLPGSLMDIAHRSLLSDSIDEVELKTGIRSEGIAFSMQNFTSKMQSGISAFIEGLILKLLHFDSRLNDEGKPQNETYLKLQWPMFMLGPVVGAILYLIFISFINDSEEHKKDVERRLKERRALMAAGAGKEETKD